MINRELAEERGLSEETIMEIERLQEERHDLLDNPERHASCPSKAQERLTSIEYALQSLWGFPLNDEYHRLQNQMRGCLCSSPKGSSLLWGIRPHCPYHGIDCLDSWDDEAFKK